MMRNCATHAQAAQVVVESIEIDVMRSAILAYHDLADIIAPPARGIYRNDAIYPIFSDKSPAYYISPKGQLVEFYNYERMFSEHTAVDLYWHNWNLAFSKEAFLAVRSYHTVQPHPAVVVGQLAIQVAKDYTRHSLNTFCNRRDVVDVSEFLKIAVSEECTCDYFQKYFPHLIETLDRFIGRDSLAFYDFAQSGRYLTVSKGLDWRIIDWYRIKENLNGQHE